MEETVDLVECVEAAKSALQERISERVCEQSGQENVEVVQIIPRSKHLDGRMNRSGLSKCPRSLARKVSWSQMSVNIIPEERIVESMSPRSQAKGPSLLRIVEQMIDVTKISDVGGGLAAYSNAVFQ